MVANRMEKQKKADGKKNLSKLSYYRCYRIVRLLFSKKRRDYILCEVKAVEKVAVHNNNTEAK